jgi:hypothetical protein
MYNSSEAAPLELGFYRDPAILEDIMRGEIERLFNGTHSPEESARSITRLLERSLE